MKKGIFSLAVVALFVTIAFTMPVAAQRVYFQPQESATAFCTTVDVQIRVNATNFQSGQLKLTYNPACANVTNFARDMTNFPIGSWIIDIAGTERISFVGMGLKTGDYLVGTLTIHCENEGALCETTLNLDDTGEDCLLFDDFANSIAGVTWEDGTFSCSDEEAPSVSTPQAVPATIDPDDTDVTTLSVTVTDNYNSVASVTVDLSAIGKSATTAMNTAGGDVYSVTTTAAVGTVPGNYNLLVTATDTSGNTNTAVSIPLAINDIVAPTVTSVSPADQAEDVDVDTTISATFSEAMDQDSVEAAFSVDGVTGTFTWAGNKITFTPGSDLAYETIYTCTINTDATDAAGNNLEENFVWEFTTEAKPARRGGGGGAPRDSDGDGYSDIEEVLAGTNLNDATDYPGKPAATPTPTPTPTPKPTATPTVPPTAKPTATPAPTESPTPTPEEPGFEAIFAIAGLLAIAYVVLRRKK